MISLMKPRLALGSERRRRWRGASSPESLSRGMVNFSPGIRSMVEMLEEVGGENGGDKKEPHVTCYYTVQNGCQLDFNSNYMYVFPNYILIGLAFPVEKLAGFSEDIVPTRTGLISQ